MTEQQRTLYICDVCGVVVAEMLDSAGPDGWRRVSIWVSNVTPSMSGDVCGECAETKTLKQISDEWAPDEADVDE